MNPSKIQKIKDENGNNLAVKTTNDIGEISLNTFSNKKIKLIDFLDSKKIPYILISIFKDPITNKKEISGIPKGWDKKSYEELQLINNIRKKEKKYKYINVNLLESDYMIVDLDGSNYKSKLKKYGNEWLTKSVSRGLPHIWFKKDANDKNGSKIGIEKNVDYLYKNTFESVDAEFENVNNNMRTFDKFPKLNEITNYIKKPKKENNKKIKKLNFENNNKKQISEEQKEIINNISVEYINNYQHWLKIIWALYNEFNDIEICNEISKKGIDTYVDIYDVQKYVNNDTKKMLSFGTIAYYSKLSNEEKYNEIRFRYNQDFINGSDMDLAKLFLNLVGDDVIKDNNQIFVYNKPYWKQDKDNNSLTILINETLDNLVKLNIKIVNEDEHNEKNNYEIKRLNQLRSSVNSYNKISNITKFVLKLLEEKSYYMDTHKPNYFCFKNVAFDLDTGNVVEVNKYDYISLHTGYDYLQPNYNDINKIKSIISEIIPDKEKKDYLLCILKNSLNGKLIEKFVLFNGNGCNGKGLILEHMQVVLGKYFTYAQNELLTGNVREGAANPALRSLHKKRCVVYSEPEEGERIKLGNLKRYTGNPTVKGRGLYEDELDINLMSMSIMECNTRPCFKGNCSDNATRRRIIDFEFDQTFTDDPKEVEEYEDYHIKNPEYKTEKFKIEMRNAFFHVILENKRSIKDIPESVNNRSYNYLMDANELGVWFEDNYEFVDDKDQLIKLSDVYDLFKSSEFYGQLSKEEKRGEWKKSNFYNKFELNVKYRKYYKDKLNLNNLKTSVRNVLICYREKVQEENNKNSWF